MAQCAGTVALAATQPAADLVLIAMALVQWVLGHAACACLCQPTSKWLKRPVSHA